jgi:hypothetical protein
VRSTAPERVAVIGAAAYQVSYLGQHDRVIRMASAAVDDGSGADSSSHALAAFAAWTSLYGSGRHDEADRFGAETVERLERDGSDRFGLVIVHSVVSYYAVARDDFTTARAEAEIARDLAREMDNPSAIASALLNLARSIERDDPAGALDAYEQSIALGRTGAMTLMVGAALVGVARVRSRTQDPDGALDALHDGITHSIYIGYRPIVVEVLGASASILLQNGRPEPGAVLAGSLLQGALTAINSRSAVEAAELEQALLAAREVLGDTEFQGLFDRGAAMSYEGVLEFALEAVGTESTS